ncbi:unannotated protein [freshwater metagenome]|uniref:Unannotated protein n=1 Tax=freshwater metagenome TaxID=449393 RepID=A0A6J6WGC1_9ZZZZ
MMPVTDTGVADDVVFPVPNCPVAFFPQHLMPASARSAQVTLPPVSIAIAVEMPLTATGVFESSPVPSPS